MRKNTRYYRLQKVTETVYNDKVLEQVIPMQVGSPETHVKSFYILKSGRWVLVHRTTDRELPVTTGPFLKTLLDVI